MLPSVTLVTGTTTDDRLSTADTTPPTEIDFFALRGEDLIGAVFGSVPGLVFRWLALEGGGVGENKGCLLCFAAIIVAVVVV